MHTLPPLPPTIIDYLVGPLVAKCSACGDNVSVQWLPYPGQIDAWENHEEALFNLCPICAVRATPQAFQAIVKDRLDHSLRVRDSLRHVLCWEPGRNGVQQLMPATVRNRTWYPPNRSSPNDPYLEEFALVGTLPADFDADGVNLARAPTYRLFRNEDPSSPSTTFAAVHLAVHARLPDVPQTFLELRWDPDNPALAWEPIIRGFGGASAKDIGRIAQHGRRLLAQHRASSGRYPDEPDSVCAVFSESLPAAIGKVRDLLWKENGIAGRPLRQRELAKALGVSVDTLQGRMTSCAIDWLELRNRKA